MVSVRLLLPSDQRSRREPRRERERIDTSDVLQGVSVRRVCLPCLVTVVAARVAVADPSFCPGEYAEDLSVLSQHARDIESTSGPYSYAVRATSSYECLSYGRDGDLKRSRFTARASGTAFGYRRDGADTFLLTNAHVAEWPAVTDDDHAVDDVPMGCKRVVDSLAIVDNDHDAYAADDIPLLPVVVDPALDVAVLRAHAKLEIIPWRVGKSASLLARNLVQVKGFPLGEFRATNMGTVVSPYDHDVQGDRDHDDFVTDALLSSGGSGSPVFAVSCRTGEFELVGIFHARYKGASALNLVVAIDQVRDLMTSLKRSKRAFRRSQDLDAAARAVLLDELRRDPDPPFFSFGPLVASLRARSNGALVFAVFASDFPRTIAPLLAIEDLAVEEPTSFGKVGAVYLGADHGLRAYDASHADAETQAQLSRVLAGLRETAVATFDYRKTLRTATASRADFNRTAERKRDLNRTLAAQRDDAQVILDLVGRERPRATGPTTGIIDVETGPASIGASINTSP